MSLNSMTTLKRVLYNKTMSFLLGFNWLDIIVLLVILFYIYEGFEVGFLTAFTDFLSFVFSFVVGLKAYAAIGAFMTQNFGFPLVFAHAGGFFLAAVITEIIINFFLRRIITRYYEEFVLRTEATIQKSHRPHAVAASVISLNKFLGIIPGMLSALVIFSFLFTVIIALPFSPTLKNVVLTSTFGGAILSHTQSFEGVVKQIFGQALSESLNFLTVKPEGDEYIALNFTTTSVIVNEEAESEMLEILNKERQKIGLRPLMADSALRSVARNHSKDMFARGYFSHYTPEGLSPFDRMAKANVIFYTTAGENLALAPTSVLAMQGFMRSKGHRENILSKEYTKVGIGAIDGGIYGIMFSQEFSN